MSYTRHTFDMSRKMAHAIRFLAVEAVEKANSGHPGMPMGMADIATVLFNDFLKFNPQDPLWPDRDRFIISNGHGSMLLYALAYLTGYEHMTLDEIKKFRQKGSITPGHPELDRAVGVETTTGPLGQGFANGVGMAIAEKLLRAEFGEELSNHHTYVFCGDGCLMEGITHEAASLAGHLGLSNLIVFFDDNHITIDGHTDLATSEDTIARFKAYGWETMAIDGHDHQAIFQAITKARSNKKPTFIACRTIIGYGAPRKQNSAGIHGSPLGANELAATKEALEWPYDAFEIPDEVLSLWRQAPVTRMDLYDQWQGHLTSLSLEKQILFQGRMKGQLPKNWEDHLYLKIKSFFERKPTQATRKSSGDVLESLTEYIPGLLGGSADLTGSNNTRAANMREISREFFHGKYLHYGVREHAMGACMNGIALHGGYIPYGGTFLCFSDYMKPAIRLSALMKQRVIYVMTHDSIGLGEDGPTHQPIEHLAALRAVPDLLVMRPADAVETAECWMEALKQDRPTVLCLSRQNLPVVRHTYVYGENLSALGAYKLRHGSQHIPKVAIISTGSEVSIALEVAQILEEHGIPTDVVSMPCWELFEDQPQTYREEILGLNTVKFAIEAASPMGWERYVKCSDHIFAIQGFGMSAPYEAIYDHFGLTPLKIATRIQEILENTHEKNSY